MNYIWKKYNKLTSKAIDKVTNVALDKFIKSEYLRDMTSIIPLTLLSITTRGIFNFLIVSRVQTSNYIINFLISLIVTITLSFSSPYIYNHLSRTYDAEIKYFSKLVIDSYWDEGWTFIERWKSIICGTSGGTIIILLFFIEVNSYMIQEFIFHTIISSVIIDYLTKLKMRVVIKPKTKTSPEIRIIEKPKDVLSRASISYSNLSSLNQLETKNNVNHLNDNIHTLDYMFIEDYDNCNFSKNETVSDRNYKKFS